jgi:hypothetical protein
MAKEAPNPKTRIRFNGVDIEVNWPIVRYLYTYAESGNSVSLNIAGQHCIDTCFKKDGFADEFALCLYTVREAVKDTYPDRLDAVYWAFKHWLDIDYTDREKDVELFVIRSHLFLDQLSAYWEWFNRMVPLFTGIVKNIDWCVQPEVYNSVHELTNSVPRSQLNMNVASKAFVSFLRSVRPVKRQKANRAWALLCERAEEITPYLPPDSVYFDRLDEPFSREEQKHIQSAFSKMGIGNVAPESTFGGPGNEWVLLSMELRKCARNYILVLEKEMEEGLMNAGDDGAKDVVGTWHRVLDDDKYDEGYKHEDVLYFKKDTLVYSLVLDRLAQFKTAERIIENGWIEYQEKAETDPIKRVFYQEFLDYHHKSYIPRSDVSWCTVRLLRLHLLECVKHMWASIVMAHASNESSSQAERARKIIKYATMLVLKKSKRDAIAHDITLLSI